MRLELSEVSPASFARRALFPKPGGMSALVVPLIEIDQFDQVTAEVRAKLTELSAHVAEKKLEKKELGRPFRSRSAANAPGNQTEVVLFTSTSEDPTMWRDVDLHRSRFENDGVTKVFVLSEGAARAMQHKAMNLRSSIGTLWAAEPRAERGLAAAIDAARAGRYPDLYEAVAAGEARDLDETTSEVLTALGDPVGDERAWRRFGFMGRAALVEVVPTIAAHWPPGLASANAVRTALDAWLSSASAAAAFESLPAAPLAPQALGEALGVVENAARLLDRTQARAAMSEILDSLFQGYAVFPGSEGRRVLFEWWLDDVVPAAAALRVPPRFNHRVKFDSTHD